MHSSIGHLEALVELAGEWDVEDLVIHAFTDGRDTSPTSGADVARRGRELGRRAASARSSGATSRWTATSAGTASRRRSTCSSTARASTTPTPREEAARAAYERDETDEFITATTVGDEARIRPGDSVIAFNFRPDRMRQITEKLTETVDRYTTMAEYDEDWDYPVALPAEAARRSRSRR